MKTFFISLASLCTLFALLVLPAAASAQLTVPQGGTGSTTLSGILYGIPANLRVQTLKIGSCLSFSGGTLAFNCSIASSTLLGDANTFSGVDKFTNSSSNFSGTWQTFSPSHFLTSLAGAASSTLLGDANTFSGINSFTNSSSNFAGTWQTFAPSHFLSSTGGDWTGTWQTFSPSHFLTSLAGAASSTLLGDTNTWAGFDTFSHTITGSISGNAATASKLAAAVTLNGVSFDGSGNITLQAASSSLLGDSNTFSGNDTFSNSVTATAGCAGCTDILLNGGINLTHARYVEATTTQPAANTFTTVYTAPVGKRALVYQFLAYNSSGGSVGYKIFYLHGGIEYAMTPTSTIATNTQTGLPFTIILEPGEEIDAMQTVSTGGLRVDAIEYDAAVPLYSAKVFSAAAHATTTLYTVPAGKTAICLGLSPFTIGSDYAAATGTCNVWSDNYGNASALTGTYILAQSGQTDFNSTSGSNWVGSAQSSLAAGQSTRSNSLWGGLSSGYNVFMAGESLKFMLNTAMPTQGMQWVNVMEH